MTMNPKERLLGAVADLQRFVIHHPDQARCPVCPRWDELQGAAMQAVTAIDDHKAELAALRALAGLPGDMCLACGGEGGHHEGCAGTTGLIALQSELAALRERNARLVGAIEAALEYGCVAGSAETELRTALGDR